MKKITLTSERLLLRTVRPSDAEMIFAYRSCPAIRKYQGKSLNSLEAIISLIKSTNALNPNMPDTWYQLAITHKQNGILLGDIGIHFIAECQAELGYTLAPQHHGYGYATEAVASVLGYLFDKLKKHRIIASTDPKNKKSVKLLLRIGMRQEAYFKKSFQINKRWADDAIYAILQSEWPEIKKRTDNAKRTF